MSTRTGVARPCCCSTAAKALIRVADIRAQLLLLGSDADDVWASGPMARAIAATLAAAGRSSSVTIETYPAATHGICGDGTLPWPRYALRDTVAARASAEANARAWQATRHFLTREFGAEK